jgi:hypothetical protein
MYVRALQNKQTETVTSMTVEWLLSPREFELRVQGLLRGCINEIHQHLGSVNEQTCPAGIIELGQGRVHIYFGCDIDGRVPIDPTTESLIQNTFDEIAELWNQQFPGIEFLIEEEVDEINLELTLIGIPLPEIQPPVDGYRETDVTEERVRAEHNDMLAAAEREEYEQAAIHKMKLFAILDERERRGLPTDIEGIDVMR